MFSKAYSVKQGIRQIERWLIAATQDIHPGIKLLHANYAVGNIDMIRQQFPDTTIKAITGKDPVELHTKASGLQDAAQRELALLCPSAMPSY